jgi:hypothetical protein
LFFEIERRRGLFKQGFKGASSTLSLFNLMRFVEPFFGVRGVVLQSVKSIRG